MNQQQEEVEIYDLTNHNRNSEEISKSLISTVFAIIYNFIWGLLFLIFRHYSNKDDTECQLIDSWTLYTEIVLFVIVAYKLFIELPIQYKTKNQWKNQLFDVADQLELFFSIVILIGLTYAYLQNEECDHLRNFVLGYLIVTYLILIIWIISYIFIACSREQFNSSNS
ncbi:unnamed protein product [Paramecium sonneborni]|uniref:Transmembrane protein n=1 Tax=Paramecium sonneborni TaxID=65129 RepID=A0A8S1Q6V6_9CILI|nr:unnamed protein product [Paramecium sonneborni]